MLKWTDLPNWLSDAPFANSVSIITLIGLGLTLRYTRRLALNDTAKMQRIAPVLELHPAQIAEVPPGWRSHTATFRNLELVGAVLTGLRATKRAGSIIYSPDIETDIQNDYGNITVSLGEFIGARTASMTLRLGPLGSKRNHRLDRTIADTNSVTIFTKGIDKPTDIELLWHWADGKHQR